VLFIAFLMASRIPHFSIKKIGRIPREYVIVVLFAIAAIVLLLASFPMEMLACLSLAYLATIPFAVLKYKAFAATAAAQGGSPA
jgi:CDP-diacylglycerol--serine O-phosphatidyltransferase